MTRTGKALVYTGYQWRGRGAVRQPTPWREVLFVERDWKTMWGRWFTGAYDETGVDVKLVAAGTDPTVFGTSVTRAEDGDDGAGSSRFSARTFRPVSNRKTSGSARA